MSRKHLVSGFEALKDADATINLTSPPTSVSNLDSASYHVSFTANNSGDFVVQARNGLFRPLQTEDGWYDLDFGGPLTITNESEVHILLSLMPFDDIRLQWFPSAGAGTITAKLSMKTEGA